jgi:hypothetical protein
MHKTARMLRVAHKLAAGGYQARVPDEFLGWLESHATPER